MRRPCNEISDDERKRIEAALTENIEIKEPPKRLHFDTSTMPAWRMKPAPKTSRTTNDA